MRQEKVLNVYEIKEKTLGKKISTTIIKIQNLINELMKLKSYKLVVR